MEPNNNQDLLFWTISACIRLQESPDTLKAYQDASAKEPKHFKKALTDDQESKTKTVIAVAEDKNQDEYTLPHPIWSEQEVDSVEINHRYCYFCY